MDPDPDAHPHHIDKLEPDPQQCADDKQKCMEFEPILALFQGVGAFIWKLGSGSVLK